MFCNSYFCILYEICFSPFIVKRSLETFSDTCRRSWLWSTKGRSDPIANCCYCVIMLWNWRNSFFGRFEKAFFFCNHFFFRDHFEELQTVLSEVKPIINNAPLTYVYPNNIETYWTLNHLLFGRQSLCYSNTTSTVVRNLTILSNTADRINRISTHFLNRWRHEYAVNLCETEQASKLIINFQKIMLC